MLSRVAEHCSQPGDYGVKVALEGAENGFRPGSRANCQSPIDRTGRDRRGIPDVMTGEFVAGLNLHWIRVVIDTAQVRRYLTFMRTTVSSKGQIVLPADLRKMDRVKPGQEFDVERLDCGDYRLVRRAPRPNQGAIDWLLACPHKDFF